ncbi:MAG: hypothetical protein IPG06_09390 [Haliea sp.]|nr:hypothetical protein [Haliea sp.]
MLQKEEGLEDSDHSELYALLKNESGIETENFVDALPLASEHLPAELATGETVILVALRELENVNQIQRTTH